jgi:hypothetical protein
MPRLPSVKLAATVAAAFVLGGGALAAGGFPVGSFQVAITHRPAPLNGTWRLVLAKDRGYTILKNGRAVVRGRLSVAGRVVTFGHETGPLRCTTSGRYRWTLTGGLLSFRSYADTCSGRRTVLTARPFRRIP